MSRGKRTARILTAAAVTAVMAVMVFMMRGGEEDAGDRPPASGLEIAEIDLDSLAGSGMPLILDMGSEGCGPCRSMKPDLEALSLRMEGRARVHYIDVWEHPEEVEGFPVRVIPTQFFFDSSGDPYVPGDDVDMEFTEYEGENGRGEMTHLYTFHEGALTEEEMVLILKDMGVEE